MSVVMEGRFLGGVATEMKHVPSSRLIETDPPVDNGGSGKSFSPTDLVGAALGACMMSILALRARKDSFSLEGMKVRVEKIMTKELPRRIDAFNVDLWLPSKLSSEQVQLCKHIAENCPVALSLKAEIKFPMTLHTV
jgi:putative redox protein